jgi:hypothetical protein
MKRTHPLTADEFADRLRASPDTVEAAKERFEKIQQSAAEYRAHTAPIVGSLRQAGISVHSISEAKNKIEAVPILLEHLRKPYPDKVLAGIANALATPAARSAWPTLVLEFCKWPPYSPGESYGPKAGLANALAATVTKDTIGELIALAKDRSHGSSRLLLLSGIRRSRTLQAKQAIEELAFDPQLAKEIASWPKMRKHGAVN